MKNKIMPVKDYDLRIYPMAYVTVDCELLDYITDTFNSLSTGDGQAILSVDFLDEEIKQLLDDPTKDDINKIKILQEIIKEIDGKAGDVYFCCT